MAGLEDIADLDEFASAIKAKRLRNSFSQFVADGWKPATGFAYLHGPHIDVVVRHLEAVAAGRITRLLMNIPPSTFKTVLSGVLFPAWTWARGQAEDFLFYGYNVTLATDASTMCRELLSTEWYQSLFPNVIVSAEDDSKQYFRLTSGGSRRVSPIGGGATGFHPSIIEIDDPLSRDESDSPAERERVRKWYFETISSRGIGKGAKHIVQQQRLNIDDLSGHIIRHHEHLLAAYGDSPWFHVRLPMRYDPSIAMEDRGFGGDWRATAGELLYPQLLDEQKVVALERSLGPVASRAQLGQDPRRSETSFFKVDRIKLLTTEQLPSKFKNLVRAWDLASTEGAGDFTAGVLKGSYRPMGASLDHYIILDVIREQTSDPIGAMMLSVEMDRRWGKVVLAVEMQPAAAGVMLDRQIRQRIKDCQIVSIRPAGSKEYRFGPFAGEINFGGLSILDGPYIPAFLSELDEYPGRHDDQADGAAMGHKALVEAGSTGIVIADEITTTPKAEERCRNPDCRRPSFGGDGYCCDHCRLAHETGVESKHSALCCNDYSDWYADRMPDERSDSIYRGKSPLQLAFPRR